LSLRENLCCVGITLNGADGAPTQQVAAEYPATSACEKSQLIHKPSNLMREEQCEETNLWMS
jgi:hypothetical protein